MESGFNVTSNSNPSISNPININTSEREPKNIEPLIVGNANAIIRFLCFYKGNFRKGAPLFLSPKKS